MSATLGENIAREWAKEARATELWDALQLSKSDPSAGVAILRELAEGRSPLAMMYLGSAYARGKYGLTADPQLAEHWLQRSAEAGSLEGAYGLVWHLTRTGRTDAAIQQYERLGERGYPAAFYALGALFYNGKLVERDLARAYGYFSREKPRAISWRPSGPRGSCWVERWACWEDFGAWLGCCPSLVRL